MLSAAFDRAALAIDACAYGVPRGDARAHRADDYRALTARGRTLRPAMRQRDVTGAVRQADAFAVYEVCGPVALRVEDLETASRRLAGLGLKRRGEEVLALRVERAALGEE